MNRVSSIGIFVFAILWGCQSEEVVDSAPMPVATSKSQSSTKLRLNPARVRQGDNDWRHAEAEIYASQAQLEEKLKELTPEELNRFVLRRGDPNSKAVSLTFDDGPHPDYTLKLLAILKQENVKATFFVVGFMADKYPDLIKAIAADGHEIGNHSYSHVTMNKIPDEEALTEWRANNDVVRRLVGKAPRYCRPPGGDFSKKTLELAATLGLTTTLWTDDPGDYSNPGDDVLMKREITELRPGAIILLHDGSSNTVDTLASFIQTVRSRGLQFVSLDGLSRR